MYLKHLFFMLVALMIGLHSCVDPATVLPPAGSAFATIILPEGFLGSSNCNAEVEGAKNLGYEIFVDKFDISGNLLSHERERRTTSNNLDGRRSFEQIVVPAEGTFLVSVTITADGTGECYSCCNSAPIGDCNTFGGQGGADLLFMGNTPIINGSPTPGQIEIAPSFVSCNTCC